MRDLWRRWNAWWDEPPDRGDWALLVAGIIIGAFMVWGPRA